jgi:hypothetical protein
VRTSFAFHIFGRKAPLRLRKARITLAQPREAGR